MEGILEWDKLSNEEILELFKQQYYQLQQPRNSIKYMKECNTPSLYIMKSRLGLTWNQALVAIGMKEEDLKCGRNLNYENIFRKSIDEIGYVPSFERLRKYLKENKKSDITSGIIRHYGTYNKFLKKIDLEINAKTPITVKETNAELLKMYKDFCIKLGRVATAKDLVENDEIYSPNIFSIRFGGLNNLRKISGFKEWERSKKRYSKLKVIDILKKEYLKNKKPLTTEEIIQIECLPSSATILTYFKTTKISEVWKQIEKELLKDYMKFYKN